VTIYSVVVGYQRFGGSSCLHFKVEAAGWNVDGGSKFLRNVGILPQHCKASQPQKTSTWTFTAWDPQISLTQWFLIFMKHINNGRNY